MHERRRFDVMLVVMALFYYNRFESVRYLILATAYVLLKDAVGGRSVGKFLFGLFVVDLETGRPSGYGACMRRNALFVLPGANVVAAFLEALVTLELFSSPELAQLVCPDPK